MEILAHRGWWNRPSEKNTMPAFIRAFDAGLGVELDIRDLGKDIVVSHDMPGLDENAILFKDVLNVWREFGRPKLAVNIKSDGLSKSLDALFEKEDLTHYFCFDMSIPETVQYRRRGLSAAGRLSEYEKDPLDVSEIWLDAFETDWWLTSDLSSYSKAGIYVVSPDLHKRPYDQVWNYVKNSGKFVGICTDQVEEAIRFFNE